MTKLAKSGRILFDPLGIAQWGTEGVEMILGQPAVTWAKALTVLNALVNVKSILKVCVVGSVAREQHGNDLDIVVVVDTYTYITFLKEMWMRLNGPVDELDYYTNYSEHRMAAATVAIEMSPAEYGWLQLAITTLGANVDLHLMPEGWMENIDAVQEHLPHDDPKFVSNIAGDAKEMETVVGVKGQRFIAGPGRKLSIGIII